VLDLERPPNIVVHAADNVLDLKPYTFCWKSGCADGVPPDPPPDIGGPAGVLIEFPVEGWTFTAEFQKAGDPCARTQSVVLERAATTTHTLRPVGYAGTYDVTVSGRGDGDVFAVFRWTTPTDGPLPVPEARLAVLADHDGAVDSYGVELSIVNLARSPAEATASVTVTAANGEALTFDAAHEPSQDLGAEGCRKIEGSLFWDAPDDQGVQAAQLGPAPFSYDVVLILDGVRYEATARWPDDQIPDNEPSVALNFQPPLPALGD
jgi:hypothetical protein